jgi:alpha-galactosidase
LEVIRDAAGDAYVLLCGTPILPALGLGDAIRIGADVGAWWDSWFYSYLFYNQTAPGVKNAIRTSVNRLWLAPLINLDPDVAFFSETRSLTSSQRRLLQDLTQVCGVRATSDLPGKWTDSQKEEVRCSLETVPAITRTGRYTFEIDGRSVDFTPAMPLPPFPRYFDALLGEILGWLGNQVWALKLWHLLFRYG